MHTRLSKCALELDDSRAFWTHAGETTKVNAQRAFDEYWFGARSLARVEVLLTNMRARFGVFPSALAALHSWQHMSPETRRAICHWHLQLTDPLYRRFTGAYLVERRSGPRSEVTRDLVVAWVGQQRPGRWTMSMRIQFASKLLSATYSAGLVTTNRDPRPIGLPRVPDEALEYLMYLLRETEFEGSLLDNPYTSSVGLEGAILEERLRGLPGLAFMRQGDLIDFGWRHRDLRMWADVNLRSDESRLAGAAL
ncbi:hypothetical protein ACTWLT_23200 [Micromonospora sp. ZYX-F-536]|uniref:hypothetical protein n=1 Tax=Micromonospora sp. ZYX-F-536 TaxID=3457629 RepID=UPI0040407341